MKLGIVVGQVVATAKHAALQHDRLLLVQMIGPDGTPTDEQTAPHDSMANAQPITLEPLVVPDTDLEGQNADQVFNVTAILVEQDPLRARAVEINVGHVISSQEIGRSTTMGE